MESWPLVGIDDETWLSMKAAAEVAGVDPRTVRRWVDRGKVEGRVTPGGTRRVARSSLVAAIKRETFARRDREPGAGVGAAPEVAVRYLAAVTAGWDTWDPRYLPEAEATALLHQVEDMINALQNVRDTLNDDIHDRPFEPWDSSG